MAFGDIALDLYDGEVKLEFRHKAHRYYISEKQPDGTFSKPHLSRGVTTVMDNVLEKKSLMTWPMSMALKRLFGFYDFEGDNGRMTGFSKNVGTLWDGDNLRGLNREDAVAVVLDASKEWTRRQKQGADIGSLVHDAIEQFCLGTPFELTVEKYKEGQEFDTPEAEYEWLKNAETEVAMAQVAFNGFKDWWSKTNPKLIGAEQLCYSREMDLCGTFDALLEIDGKRILCDWKTTKASIPAGAPMGVYYSYFLQLGAYAAMWQEMHATKSSIHVGVTKTTYDQENGIDDLMVVSARKDGGFDTVLASQVGLTVNDCIQAWKSLFYMYAFISRTKKQLVEIAK